MKTDSAQRASDVQLARLRVATAESRWRSAKQEARVARRRRKEVKIIARRAKDQAKLAKVNLAEARKALAKAEAKLAMFGVRVATRKPAKTRTRPVAKGVAAASKKKAVTVRKRRSQATSPSPTPGFAAQVAPAPRQENDASRVLAPTEPTPFASQTTETTTTITPE